MRPPSRIKSRSHPKNEEVGLGLPPGEPPPFDESLPGAADLLPIHGH
jgi:hypothetical protein